MEATSSEIILFEKPANLGRKDLHLHMDPERPPTTTLSNSSAYPHRIMTSSKKIQGSCYLLGKKPSALAGFREKV